MSSYKDLTANDIKTSTTFLNQLVDVVAQDVSSSAGSSTRKSYQVFVTGGVGPGVTSSLFQTVFDQDFSLQTSNAMFDMTVGLFSGSDTVAAATTGQDTNGKILFTSKSMMMREKINIYRQYAQLLLGDADAQFAAPFGSATTSNKINEAFFISFKRLFHRDGIKRETFAMKFFQTGTLSNHSPGGAGQPRRTTLDVTSQTGSAIFTDVGSSTNIERSQTGGDVGNIVDAANTSRIVGNIFYQQGIVVYDLSKIISGSQHVSGVIPGMRAGNVRDYTSGQIGLGTDDERKEATYIPGLMISGSIDTIVNHLASCRFGDGSTVAMTFQNETAINSTLVFCRAEPDEFNFSSNPTYTDASNGRLRVIDTGQEGKQLPFSMITTVGLYNEADSLLAVAKMSRPIEKNEEKDITFRVRLDF